MVYMSCSFLRSGIPTFMCFCVALCPGELWEDLKMLHCESVSFGFSLSFKTNL